MAKAFLPPLISVVTPSLNQGKYIRQTIDSVLSQSYPHIEYVVVDGGSTDETLDILKSYGDRFSWVSEPDSGQSDAINKGLRMVRGEIVTWLNSDDLYQPDTLQRVAAFFAAHPDVGLVYGNGEILDEEGRSVGPFVDIEPFNIWRLLYFLNHILQPAAFYRRSALEKAGLLDENLNWAMDWDLWIRLAAQAEVRYLPETLAFSREYSRTKTASGGWKRIRELGTVPRRYTGRFWTPGVLSYALDTLRVKLQPITPRFLNRALDWVVTLPRNRLPTFADRWLGPNGKIMIPRRWGGANLEFNVHKLPRSGRFELHVSNTAGQHDVLPIDRPGLYRHSVLLPADGDGPFAEIIIASDYSFRPKDDPRNLSVVCSRVAPLDAAALNIGELDNQT